MNEYDTENMIDRYEYISYGLHEWWVWIGMTWCNWWIKINKIDMNYKDDIFKNTTWYLLLDGTGYMDLTGLLGGHRCYVWLDLHSWPGFVGMTEFISMTDTKGCINGYLTYRIQNVWRASDCYKWPYGERFYSLSCELTPHNMFLL